MEFPPLQGGPFAHLQIRRETREKYLTEWEGKTTYAYLSAAQIQEVLQSQAQLFAN